MRIKSISWKNYRQYQDKTIRFPLNKKWDLHYFIAENGIGKTTFFNSVSWCLYDDEPYLTDKDRAFSILSKSVKKKMQVGDLETVKVELVVECEQGEIHYIREADMRKTEEGDLIRREMRHKVVTVFFGQDATTYNDEDAVLWVNKFVPERLRDYYFFDAEGLRDYFNNESNSKVRKAVFEISDIETMNLMVERLEIMEAEYRGKVTKNNPKTESMNRELDELLERKRGKIKELNLAQNELEIAEKGLEECKKVLDNEPDVDELEESRKELMNIISEYEKKEINAKSDIKAFARRYTYLLNAYPQMIKMFDKLCEMEKNDELPPKIMPEYLKEMIRERKCLVCNRDFDGASLMHVEQLVALHHTKETLIELNTIKGSLQSLIEETKRYPERRDALLEHLKEIQDILNRTMDEKVKLDRKYADVSDAERIKYYSKMRVNYEKTRREKDLEVAILKRDLDDLQKRCDKLTLAIEEEISKENTQKHAEKCRRLAAKGKMVISQIIEDIRDDVRQQISEETSKRFLEMIWKEVTYTNVGLTEEYAISAMDDDGEEGVGSTSGAEGQLLALSFILALQSVSGFNSPLIIDTPVARTSGKLRGNFCEVLRKVSEKQQVILFFTEDEFNSRVQDALQGYESNRYELQLVDEQYVDVRCING